MSSSNVIELAPELKQYPDGVCADCLESAGGRQQKHGCVFHVDYCPCCYRKTTVTAPANFGSPVLKGHQRP